MNMKSIIKSVAFGLVIHISGTPVIESPVKFIILAIALHLCTDDYFLSLIGVKGE